MLIEEKPRGFHKLARALQLRCPNCGRAAVFYPAHFPGARPKIRERCENCGYEFHPSIDFYKGAVYLSYGLTIIEGLLAAVFARLLIFGLSNRDLILITIGTMFFVSVWNYRLARVLWLSYRVQPEKTN